MYFGYLHHKPNLVRRDGWSVRRQLSGSQWQAMALSASIGRRAPGSLFGFVERNWPPRSAVSNAVRGQTCDVCRDGAGCNWMQIWPELRSGEEQLQRESQLKHWLDHLGMMLLMMVLMTIMAMILMLMVIVTLQTLRLSLLLVI